MNRNLKIIRLVLWIIISITLLFILIYNISYKNKIGFNLNFNGKEFSNMTVQKEESMSLDECSNIKIDFSSEEIKLTTVDDEDLKVIQESSKELSDDEKFTLTKNGDTITVQKNATAHIGFFKNDGFQRIQVFLPKKYAKALNITSSSGDISIASQLFLSDIECDTSSGKINLSDNLQVGNKAFFKSTSGDINLKGLSAKESSFIASSGHINLAGTNISEKSEIKTTSGDIKLNELDGDYTIESSSGQIKVKSLSSGSGTINSTSGDIDVIYKGLNDYSNIKSSSGTVHANVNKDINFEFDGKCSSGDINSNFSLNYTGKKRNEANVKVGNAPYKKISITTTSGDIDIKNS